jgi:hypothetical protein
MSIKLINVHLTRQMGTISTEVLGENITIIGAGAVGSFVTLALSKMGFSNITVYDFDKVAEENLNAQCYRWSDVGKPKVEALKDVIKQFSNIDINAKNQKYEGGSFPGIVISCVDSMVVRSLLWNSHKECAPHTKLYIDGRMAIQNALCYAMKPMDEKDIVSYEKTLYTDSESIQEPCTNKAISFTSMLLGGHIAKVVKDFLTKEVPYSRVTMWSIKDNKQECYPVKS